MAEEIKKDLADQVNQIVRKQREIAEKFGIDSAEYKRYVEQSDAKMAEFDKKNDAQVKELAEQKNLSEQLKQRIENIESNAVSINGADQKEVRQNYHNIVNAITKKQWGKLVEEDEELAKSYFDQMASLSTEGKDFPTEAKQFQNLVAAYDGQKASPELLRTDIGEYGGFLVPNEWSNELLRQIIEVSPCRSFARVKTIGGKTLMQPVRQGVPRALWAGETESSQDSISNYTLEEMTPHRLTHTVPITWDMINDSGYNISEELMTDSRIAFAQAEGFACVKGDGVKKPLGFTVDPDVPNFNTATNTLTFDDMINITGELKSGYDPMYMFNRRTLAYLRTLSDNTGRYLWSGPFGDAASGAGATINGYRYSSAFIDMDDYDVDGGNPVLFSDFFRFYTILDRTDMMVIRDEVTRKREGIVEFTLMKWTEGKVVMKEAGVLMTKIA